MKLGLYIGRLNPPHIGHIQTIKKALKQNDKVLLFLGDNGKLDKKNIYTFEKRKFILENVFLNEKNLVIKKLLDTPTDKEWLENIKKELIYDNIKELNIYGGDFQNDIAIISIKEYEYILDIDNINYILTPRSESYIEYKGKKLLISSTLLRQAINDKDTKLIDRLTLYK